MEAHYEEPVCGEPVLEAITGQGEGLHSGLREELGGGCFDSLRPLPHEVGAAVGSRVEP